MANEGAGGQPVYILREGSTQSKGRDAQQFNIMAAVAVAEAVKSTLGPKGMDKMLVDPTGNVTVTNDGATILREVQIDHPAAQMIVEVARAQDDEVGDGTTTAVVLAGELLRKASDLMDRQIHPTVIATGYRMAADKAKELLQTIAVPVEKTDRELLEKIAFTAMTGKGAEAEGAMLSKLAVDAVLAVEDAGKVDTDNVKVEKMVGPGAMASQLIKGIALGKTRVVENMPKAVSKAKILLLNASMEIKKTQVDASIKIKSPQQMKTFLEQEEAMLLKNVEAISKSGANVLFCQKGMDDLVASHLGKKGIFAIKSVSESDMKKLSRATGARIVTKIEEIDPKDLGYAGIVEERKVSGDESLTFVEECKNPKAVTLFVRAGTATVMDELERALHDAIRVVSVVVEDGKVVPAGGAPEIELSLRLKQYASTIGGREQLAIESFANAMEIIPRTLAENAGLDPIDMLVSLRSKHEAKNGKNFGLNVYEGKPIDMLAAGIIEPLRVKTQAVGSAAEAAVMILRIDDVIASGGPSEQTISEAKQQAKRQLAAGRMGGGMPPGMGGFM
ncbi:chaperonin Hsp60 (GroEL-like) [Methanocella arvoryzae MRE50]|uniref:Chaperonin Hsp60 (GroEL-like) n=1 Tax=Methanocella arvoryzae (strain DSM 22066 / NBRC 105507 / MRE50) TaxID=351160 RepID=Q0W309_METAR|nr:thermosome subunit alpha [Methanocella arvoryzae]CAJ37234.1 chaperonin Hsp60 (GroEL-like) [Methanocella arvoryzae MRE50]